MYQFTYYAPTEVIFGADSILKTESLIKKYGGKKCCCSMAAAVCVPPAFSIT